MTCCPVFSAGTLLELQPGTNLLASGSSAIYKTHSESFFMVCFVMIPFKNLEEARHLLKGAPEPALFFISLAVFWLLGLSSWTPHVTASCTAALGQHPHCLCSHHPLYSDWWWVCRRAMRSPSGAQCDPSSGSGWHRAARQEEGGLWGAARE